MRQEECIMKAEGVNVVEWQARYGTEEACATALAKRRWPGGFVCPKCGHDHGYYVTTRRVYQCAHCGHQASVTAGTLFHSTNLPLVKWFWAIYLSGSDKGGISAERLRKLIGVSWITASRMLRKLRAAMGERDARYRLTDLIELDDALVGGRRSGGKRGRGAEGKTPILVAVENRGERAGFVAIEVTPSVSLDTVKGFVERHIAHDQFVRSDALGALRSVAETQHHAPRVTPPAKAGEWLPWVHVVIGNLKAFLLGTYHGVSPTYLQEYLNEFCYRFNRRQWEAQLPHRLLNICIAHKPLTWAENS
jgi:transposase-like protein